MSTLLDRYRTDPVFHALVTTLETVLASGEVTLADLGQALRLLAQQSTAPPRSARSADSPALLRLLGLDATAALTLPLEEVEAELWAEEVDPEALRAEVRRQLRERLRP